VYAGSSGLIPDAAGGRAHYVTPAPGKAIRDNGAMSPPSRAKAPSFSVRQFRAALGMFATGVTIVTARDADGAPIGLTANSFNSVSLDPPLVLWSLAREAGSMPHFARGSHYAINILAAEQRELAERFSRKQPDRFAGVPFREGSAGAPILEGAAAVFECFNRSRYAEGDHVIFVGEVERCERRADAKPLIFHGGKYFTELPL
jgi:flavin reductase (DIM6/NTAB) family NADH-FMN oxidoreductase RutF